MDCTFPSCYCHCCLKILPDWLVDPAVVDEFVAAVVVEDDDGGGDDDDSEAATVIVRDRLLLS